ncbi:hypothetical protein BLA18110_03372 [Burkholderia lata]|nr:hypothetical protein BLA18110_03372 [Burkholderia lata]
MHLVQTMAYVGAEPWHGLGNKLAPKQPLEVWAQAAGMDWRIEEAEVRFVAAGGRSLGSIHAFPEQKVLYRSDTKMPLSVVSSRYQVVQPEEILEFYRDLTEIGGFQLETAGEERTDTAQVVRVQVDEQLLTDEPCAASQNGARIPHTVAGTLIQIRVDTTALRRLHQAKRATAGLRQPVHERVSATDEQFHRLER